LGARAAAGYQPDAAGHLSCGSNDEGQEEGEINGRHNDRIAGIGAANRAWHFPWDDAKIRDDA